MLFPYTGKNTNCLIIVSLLLVLPDLENQWWWGGDRSRPHVKLNGGGSPPHWLLAKTQMRGRSPPIVPPHWATGLARICHYKVCPLSKDWNRNSCSAGASGAMSKLQRGPFDSGTILPMSTHCQSLLTIQRSVSVFCVHLYSCISCSFS